MKRIDMFDKKRVLVLGLAKSGYNAALLLHELGAEVVVNDGKTPEDLTDVRDLMDKGITVITGEHPMTLFDSPFDYMVKNPGIPYHNDMVQKALSLDIPVYTDVELAYLISQAPIIGITGTNGKTTTTTLLTNMLQPNPNGAKTWVAGNIGIPATTVAKQAKAEDVIVMELSSFQLMGVQAFRPMIAIITNIYEAHVDYHGSREAYVAAKLNLLKQQVETDVLILNGDLKESEWIAQHTKAKVHYFSKSNPNADATVVDGEIKVFGETIMHVADIKVPGLHNLENVLASALAARLYGQDAQHIQAAVQQFTGVKHRSQFVKTVNGRSFYNDSKATNILATQMALDGFEERVILIAGGLDRGNGFETLVPSLEKVKTLVVYGQTRHKLEQAGHQAHVTNVIGVETLEEAVAKAYENSVTNDVILFSPACASWDQFANFEERGDAFIEFVEKIGD